MNEKTILIYSITARNNLDEEETHTFRVTYEYGEPIAEESYNPVSGWTNYTHFTDGWSHFSVTRNELRNAIKDYATSEDLANIINDVELSDIGRTYSDILFCNRYVEVDKEYDFEVEIEDVYIERDDT